MAFSLRYAVAKKIKEALEKFGSKNDVPLAAISQQLRLEPSNKKVSYGISKSFLGLQPASLSSMVYDFCPNGSVVGVVQQSDKVLLQIQPEALFSSVLQLVTDSLQIAQSSLCHKVPKLTTIVEFSSPNIAKPFHMGHLRSTIIGAFLSNLHEKLGHNVIRINFLGDWGTQFGYLKNGFDKSSFKVEDLGEDAMQKMFSIYVDACKKGKTDASISVEARKAFSEMESGDEDSLTVWRIFRDVSIEEFKKAYRRLGIDFDYYHGESMYGINKIDHIFQILKNKDLLQTHNDGREIVKMSNGQVCTLKKSDGTAMYLTRDMAAAIHRYKQFRFDKMFYVVDNAQSAHFETLFELLSRVDHPSSDKCRHIKFGRFMGMSTREGSVVFLKDVLNEARRRAKEQLDLGSRVSPNEMESTADVLGVSAVVINDLKHKRLGDAKFDWEKMLKVKGNTGIQLQYTHCRLVSLEQQAGVCVSSNADPRVLVEPEALQLALTIARFEDVIANTLNDLEACVMVNYLFSLCKAVNRALTNLQVKNQNEEVAVARLALFHAARAVLHTGMSIVGLTPLNKM